MACADYVFCMQMFAYVCVWMFESQLILWFNICTCVYFLTQLKNFPIFTILFSFFIQIKSPVNEYWTYDTQIKTIVEKKNMKTYITTRCSKVNYHQFSLSPYFMLISYAKTVSCCFCVSLLKNFVLIYAVFNLVKVLWAIK